MTSSVRRLMEGNTLNDSPSGTLDHSPCGTHIPVTDPGVPSNAQNMEVSTV